MRPAFRIAGAAAIAAGGALAALAQGAPQDPKQPPIRTQANYVRVDVYPTVDGRPVMDLHAEDFEVLEDGKPQAVTAFEYVLISAGGPQAQRTDPASVEASRQAASNPRARIVVIFLDTAHVSVLGTWSIREPLIRMLDRLVGPDDLVGVMTPDMAPSQMTLARKTEIVEGSLRARWPWGTRGTVHEDPRDRDYANCYPDPPYGDLAQQMMVRRRERLTLEALNDLVHYLRDLREERKAVLAVTEGWRLFSPNPDLTRLRKSGDWEEPVPGRDPIGVGPGGRITLGKPNEATGGLTKTSCDTDRMRLAQADNEVFFRDIIDNANRANTSFYPVDARGLAAADSPTGTPNVIADTIILRRRLDTLATLAGATDGLALTNSNDLDASLKRMSDDLSSYYLLGYYATNTKLDGRFRRIEVRVKRPGVQVRARRGYRAPTEAEVLAARAAAAPPPVSAETAAANAAMEALTRIRPEARFRIHATPFGEGDGAVSLVWVAGELQPPPAADPWRGGGTGDIDVQTGGTTTTARVTLAPGERTFLTAVPLPSAVSSGAIDVRARLTGTDPDAARLADSIHVPLTAGSRPPLLFRRGPTTGNRLLPAATFLFSRTERVRVEIPVPAGARPGIGRLIERGGQTSPVPVAVGARTDDATGRHWITADVTLAPLGAGDYTIEVTTIAPAGEHKVFTAIRVVR